MALHLTPSNSRISLRHSLPASSSLALPPRHSFNCRRPPPLRTSDHSRNAVKCVAVSPCDVRMSKRVNNNNFVEEVLKVREYELDAFGVVNNAVYANYCQNACQGLLETYGVHGDSWELLALSELSLKFIAPLRRGDKFLTRLRVTDMSFTRLYAEFFIYKLPNLEPIVEANLTGVWLDKSYRPMRIPSQVKSKIKQNQSDAFPTNSDLQMLQFS